MFTRHARGPCPTAGTDSTTGDLEASEVAVAP